MPAVTHAYPTTMRPSFQATIQARGQPSASPKRMHAQCGYQKTLLLPGFPLFLRDETEVFFEGRDDKFLRS